MGQESIHDLAAAYAMDALDESERHAFEQHLSDCDRCSGEIDGLREAAVALAWASEGPSPPPALRERLIEQARAERASAVTPMRRRPWLLPAAAALAAIAACAAIGLGVWASRLSTSLDRERATANANARAAMILASAGTRLKIGNGHAVVTSSGTAAVALPDLGPAPVGKTYEAWVIGNQGPRAAGLFKGAKGGTLLMLQRPVPHGARIGISLEPAGGSPQPTTVLFLSEAT